MTYEDIPGYDGGEIVEESPVEAYKALSKKEALVLSKYYGEQCEGLDSLSYSRGGYLLVAAVKKRIPKSKLTIGKMCRALSYMRKNGILTVVASPSVSEGS